MPTAGGSSYPSGPSKASAWRREKIAASMHSVHIRVGSCPESRTVDAMHERNLLTRAHAEKHARPSQWLDESSRGQNHPVVYRRAGTETKKSSLPAGEPLRPMTLLQGCAVLNATRQAKSRSGHSEEDVSKRGGVDESSPH